MRYTPPRTITIGRADGQTPPEPAAISARVEELSPMSAQVHMNTVEDVEGVLGALAGVPTLRSLILADSPWVVPPVLVASLRAFTGLTFLYLGNATVPPDVADDLSAWLETLPATTLIFNVMRIAEGGRANLVRAAFARPRAYVTFATCGLADKDIEVMAESPAVGAVGSLHLLNEAVSTDACRLLGSAVGPTATLSILTATDVAKHRYRFDQSEVCHAARLAQTEATA